MKKLRKTRPIFDKPGNLRPGSLVTVRAFAEVVSTLDATGALDGLPFLPEMLKYCGRTFTVRRRVNKLIQEGIGASMRRIKNVVLLDGTVCDGRAHGDCRRACFPLWKIDWLEPAGKDALAAPKKSLGHPVVGPSHAEALLPQQKVCQVTELMTATAPLPLWDPRRHYWDISSGTYKPAEYIAYILGGVHRKTLKRIVGRIVKKRAPAHASLAIPDALDLEPGDLVEVKSAAEIRPTLNAEGRSQGLYFMPGMWEFCGRRLRVLHRVDRMMSEKTGELRNLNRIVILEGVTCDGKAHGGCQRGCYIFWKDTWLTRAGTPAQPAIRPTAR